MRSQRLQECKPKHVRVFGKDSYGSAVNATLTDISTIFEPTTRASVLMLHF